jgi:hypothetical protein
MEACIVRNFLFVCLDWRRALAAGEAHLIAGSTAGIETYWHESILGGSSSAHHAWVLAQSRALLLLHHIPRQLLSSPVSSVQRLRACDHGCKTLSSFPDDRFTISRMCQQLSSQHSTALAVEPLVVRPSGT